MRGPGGAESSSFFPQVNYGTLETGASSHLHTNTSGHDRRVRWVVVCCFIDSESSLIVKRMCTNKECDLLSNT